MWENHFKQGTPQNPPGPPQGGLAFSNPPPPPGAERVMALFCDENERGAIRVLRQIHFNIVERYSIGCCKLTKTKVNYPSQSQKKNTNYQWSYLEAKNSNRQQLQWILCDHNTTAFGFTSDWLKKSAASFSNHSKKSKIELKQNQCKQKNFSTINCKSPLYLHLWDYTWTIYIHMSQTYKRGERL